MSEFLPVVVSLVRLTGHTPPCLLISMTDQPSRSQHKPVLSAETIEQLQPDSGQFFVDGTLGGGGHTRLLCDRVGPGGLVLGVDRDPAAVLAAETNLAGLPLQVSCANYCEIPEILAELGRSQADGILLDLGLSSDQLASIDRGFSFNIDAPLDLRFNPHEGEPAWRLLERISAEMLANILYEFGEERYSRRIARAIVRLRREEPVRKSGQLAQIVRRCVPRAHGGKRIDPATRTFQALRIAVNNELGSLQTALRRLPHCLRVGGRLAVISFHSLEDRMVKQAMRDDATLKEVFRKPIRPGEMELANNSRSRSARLRVAERVSS